MNNATPKDVNTRHILVVDDHELVLKSVIAMLESEGLEALAAGSGKEALSAVQDIDTICCVLLDLSMPNMSGEEVLEELVRIRPDLPVLVYSAHEESAVSYRLTHPNVSGYWQKPFEIDVLTSRLRELVKKRE